MNQVTWSAARTKCESEGTRLVKIDTQERQDSVVEFLAQGASTIRLRKGCLHVVTVSHKLTWRDLYATTHHYAMH